MRDKTEWLWGRGEKNAFFVVVTSRQGSTSMRAYDARTGIAVSEIAVARGAKSWPREWPFLATMKSVAPRRFPNLTRECKSKLPKDVFDDLRSQVEPEMAKLPALPQPKPLTREIMAKYLDQNVLDRWWPEDANA